MDNQPERKGEEKKQLSPWAVYALAGEIGYLIAVPAVVFGFGGAYLDKTLGTSPIFIVLGLSLALTVSMMLVCRVMKRLQSQS